MQHQPVGWSDIKMGAFPTVASSGPIRSIDQIDRFAKQNKTATTTGVHSVPAAAEQTTTTTTTTTSGRHAQRDL